MIKKTLLAVMLAGAALSSVAAPQAEKLGRGAIAMKTDAGMYISWRSLESDARLMSFDVYRDGVKVNAEPITNGTNFTDPAGTATSKYVIKAMLDNAVVEEATADVWGDVYKRLKLNRPASGVSKPGGKEQMSSTDYTYTYTPNDMSVGDVDGDGEYELFVKWDPSNSADNSHRRNTGNVIIDCYKLDGTQLWRIDLGQNIRAGAHYTQFMVYDLDGDGKAELACKTAPGTIDGQGKAVLMGSDKVTDDYRTQSGDNTGTILKGSEYLTVFNGETGAEITSTAYLPARSKYSWGDSYGNRSERYLACVAYLDGQKPSLVMCRGYYTQSCLVAWDFDGKNLTKRWEHYSDQKGKGAYGEGAHSLTVGDVDGDGCDEIVYGSASIDHDGSLLYRTGAGHGDALHLGDFDPDREGLEIFMVHEEKSSAYKYDCEFRDAKTGEIIWYEPQSGNDIGRGLVGDLSDTWRGYEIWPGSRFEGGVRSNATFDCKGNILVGKVPSSCFRLYWDGDLNDELFDGKYDSGAAKANPIIEKRAANLGSSTTLMEFKKWNAQSCNTTKATPCLSADILGDWREEVILWDYNDPSEIMIFSTTIPSKYRVPCLMQDHNYRMAIAWQNVAYNQPPHLGYYLPDRFSTDAQIKIASGSATQTIDLGYEIEPINGTVVNADNLSASGLPDGVTLAFDKDALTFTVSGKPLAAGEYKYTLTANGEENVATLEGTITVRKAVVLTPLAQLPFEEVGETTPNLVFGNATVRALTGVAPTQIDGVVGKAILFDGSHNYVRQENYDAIQLGEKDFSIEFWFKTSDPQAYIFHKGSIDYNWVGLELKNGLLKFAVDDDVVKSECSGEITPYLDNTWHHCVAVREHSQKKMYLYVDGILLGEATDGSGNISDNGENMVIGNSNIYFDNFFAGAVDEFCLYEGAMSVNQVQDRYNALKEAAGIGDINVDVPSVAKLTLVDATTGIVIARGVGAVENVTANVAPGVYVLLIENGKSRETRKFVKD